MNAILFLIIDAVLPVLMGLLFDVQITPELSFEGGPVVVRLAATYRGRAPIQILAESLHDQLAQVEVSTPPGWKEKPKLSITDGLINRSIPAEMTRIKPGDRFSIHYFLHHQFEVIPKGQATFVVKWDLYLTERGQKKITLLFPVRLTVGAVTDQAVDRVVEILKESARRSSPGTLNTLPSPEDYIIGTTHPKFFELGIAWLGSGGGESARQSRLAYFLASRAAHDQALMSLIHRYLIGKRPRGASYLLYSFASENNFLTEKEWKELYSHAQSALTRVLIQVIGKVVLSNREKTTLYRQLAEVAAPLPPETILAAVQRLSSDSFSKREYATRELISMGESAEQTLKTVDLNRLLPEARKRLQLVLKEINRQKPDPLILEAIRTLEIERTRDSIDALRALAKAPIGTSVRREATAAIRRLGEK